MSIFGYNLRRRRSLRSLPKKMISQNEKEMERENNKEYIDNDEGIKIVRRTMSSEVGSGIVIAVNTDENCSPSDSFIFKKGYSQIVVSMMTVALLSMLDDYGFSLDNYINNLLRISIERKKGNIK